MEDKKVIKNEKQEITKEEYHRIFLDRMICECQNIHEVKEEDIKNKNNRR